MLPRERDSRTPVPGFPVCKSPRQFNTGNAQAGRQSRGELGFRPMPEADGGITYEVDPDFLEHARREACEQPEPPWGA